MLHPMYLITPKIFVYMERAATQPGGIVWPGEKVEDRWQQCTQRL